MRVERLNPHGTEAFVYWVYLYFLSFDESLRVEK